MLNEEEERRRNKTVGNKLVDVEPPRHACVQHGDVGASSSAVGGSMTWISVVVATTAMSTQTVAVESIPTLSSNCLKKNFVI